MDEKTLKLLKEKTIWYQRHGEGTHNKLKNGMWQNMGASHDPALTSLGKLQAVQSGQFLKNKDVELVVYSLSKRTQQTASIIVKQLSKAPKRKVSFAPLHEYNGGENEGLLSSYDRATFQVKDMPRAETPQHLHARVIQALEFIARQPETNVLIVAHSRIGRMFFYVAEQPDYPIEDFDKAHTPLPHDQPTKLVF